MYQRRERSLRVKPHIQRREGSTKGDRAFWTRRFTNKETKYIISFFEFQKERERDFVQQQREEESVGLRIPIMRSRWE